MAINKVIFGNQTLMDTTEVTVTPNTMIRGTTALAANGETITGTLDTAPLYNDLDKTSEGYALDARQGKVLNDKITELGDPVTIAHGGTGASTAIDARTNLNVYSKDEIDISITNAQLGFYIDNEGYICQK